MGRMNASTFVLLVSLFAPGVSPAPPQASDPGRYFTIEVVDEQTGRGVPMVELQTTYGRRDYTDSAGLVAFDEPGLMGRRVFFGVSAHGYEFAKDGFGIRGVVLAPEAGGAPPGQKKGAENPRRRPPPTPPRGFPPPPPPAPHPPTFPAPPQAPG